MKIEERMDVNTREVTDTSRCDLCDEASSFSLFVMDAVDGDLRGEAHYCREHAIELAWGGRGLPMCVCPPVETRVDQRCDDGCDDLPPNPQICPRCARLADVRLTASADDEGGSVDHEPGVYLCRPCAAAELRDGMLPAEVRSELRKAIETPPMVVN